MNMSHLYNHPKREEESINRLINGNLMEMILYRLQLPVPSWLGIRLPKEILIERKNKNFPGDVDLMGGSYKGWLDNSNTPIVFPNYEFLWAFEVKAYYYSRDIISVLEMKEKGLRATKQRRQQKKFKKQAENLILMGFNQVYLLHIVAIEPTRNSRVNPWIGDNRAFEAIDAIKGVLVIEDNDPFGQAVVIINAVPHKTEDMAGGIACEILKKSKDLTSLQSNKIRSTVVYTLNRLFGNYQQYHRYVQHCRNCNQLFLSSKLNEMCQQCN